MIDAPRWIPKAGSALDRFRPALARVGLPAWFVAVDLLWIAKPDVFGIDARHYQRAASAWLGGGDPWTVAQSGVTFASGPHTLLFFAPTSVLPLDLAVAAWMLLGAAASIWLVQKLKLPVWWFLFPPLFHAVWNGNAQSISLALLVFGGPAAGAAAVGLKLYAAIPLVRHPRNLVIAGLALTATLPLLPVELYLQNGLGVSDHVQTAWNGSAWRFPILVPPTLLALWLIRRHGAEWLAVPAVWPATQFYYVAMALPALVQRPILASVLALPVPLMTPVVVMTLALLQVRGERLASRSTSPTSRP